MSTGVVKWFNPEKGFGFIKPDVAGPDIFVHMSEVKKSGLQCLDPEDEVSFDMEKSTKTGRFGAVNIKIK